MGEEPCNIELGLAIGFFPLRAQKEGAHEERLSRNELQTMKMKSKINREEENKGNNEREGAKKKLRLTKEQLASLEDSFRSNVVLNPSQKQELAKQLNLRPRQVEVWFQNRRARTKLKQTEVDCELLKRCCESLSHENQRLKRELQELRSVKPGLPPFYTQLPKAPLMFSVCPSCERIKGASSSSSSIAC